MNRIRRTLTALSILPAVFAGAGCSVKCTEHGVCFKPLFRVRFEINRTDDHVGRWHHKHGGNICAPCQGDLPIGGSHMGAPIIVNGHSGPLTTHRSGPIITGDSLDEHPELEPIHTGPIAPALPQETIHAKPILDGGIAYPITLPTDPPITPVPRDTSSQQSAKKKPGALRVDATLQMRGTNVLRVGDRVAFAIDVDNTGELDIESSTLSAVFSDNLKPVEVVRRVGSSFDDLSASKETRATIDGQKVTFNPIEGLTSAQKIRYQITAEVLKGASAGKLEVSATSTALGSEPLRREVPVTIQ